MKSIKTKLISAFTILIVTITMSIGAIAIANEYFSLHNEVEKSLELLAAQGAKTTESRMETLVTVLELAAQKNEIIHMGWDVDLSIMKEELSKTDYLDIGYVLSNGYTYYTDGTVRLMSDRSYIQKALKGGTEISDVIISRVTRKPEIEVAVPVYKGDEIVGALVGRKEADTLGSITQDLRYGENGYSFIINGEGTMIANPDQELVLKRYNPIEERKDNPELVSIAEAFRSFLANKTGSARYQYAGSNYYAGYAPIENTSWCFVITADQKEVLSALPQTVNTIIIAMILVIILGMGLVYILNLSITRPLIMMTKHSKKIADLNVSENISEQFLKQKDEVGTLYGAFQELTKKLREIIMQLVDTADIVNQTAQTVSHASYQSVQACGELSVTVNEIAKGAEKQVKNTELGANHAKTLGEIIEKNHTHMSELTSSSRHVEGIINEGLREIKQLSELTISNEKATREICNTILLTKKSSEQIREASRIISEITQETNLLSFNAAIEAARAGEAGLGFSVVASEVQKLAEQSAQSAGYIDGIVQELQSNMAKSIEGMDKISETSAKQRQGVYDMINKYHSIADSIHISQEVTGRLDESMEAMQQVKNEMLIMLQSLAAIAQQNAAGTQQASAAMQQQATCANELASVSDKMSVLADTLQVITTRFAV